MEVVLELSRKCNIRCEHCLRGKARNQVMSDEVIYETIHQAKEAGFYNLIVGGGEPSIATEQLHTMMDAMEELSYSPETFWLVTNRKVLSDEFLRFLDRLNDWFEGEYAEFVTIAYSDDMFHVDDIDPNWTELLSANKDERYFLKEEFPDDLEDDYDGDEDLYYDAQYEWEYRNGYMFNNLTFQGHGPSGYDKLLNMGFAAEELGCGNGEGIYEEDAISMNYVAVNGDIYPSCNLSYNVMDKSKSLKKGNIMNGSLDDFNNSYLDKWFEEEGLQYEVTEFEYELDPELISEEDE